MLHRRRILGTGMAGAAVMACRTIPVHAAAWSSSDIPPKPLPDEDLIQWIERTKGAWSQELYLAMLGAANPFKEGDAILGVAAVSEEQRQIARELLSNTPIAKIDARPPFLDSMHTWNQQWRRSDAIARVAAMTFGELKEYLTNRSEAEIHAIKDGLSSDAIACVVKLMSNEELIRVGANVFNPLPGSFLGARGYMGARIQPNSPTDHPDDIRWQVFNAFAFAVGDVLIGTNPVSSESTSVRIIEETLKEIISTFGLTGVLPHCVLAHIDVQAQVERESPGSTALWFQSIAGSDDANGTFDVTLEKMVRHAEKRTGPYALYFETGQGADFTNGHGHGTDMVIHESRKYGFVRGLMRVVSNTRERQALSSHPWVHVNDVAGFIGPEVFRNRDQLVRCCLEDIVMGKLHGLMIGLDVCTTLHMDVSLDDLGWCIEQIMPASPGYLMALPTRIDPMLGYLTTGYHDHVRIREQFGYRVNDAMWSFFQQLGVIDSEGKPTEHFGDPVWVYQQYCRRNGDPRSSEEITIEAQHALEQVRQRGVLISQGYDREPSRLPSDLDQEIHRIYDDAKRCIWAELPEDFAASIPSMIPIATQSADRNDYILHPASGEALHPESTDTLQQFKINYGDSYNALIVLSDGLNALALTSDAQAKSLLEQLERELKESGIRVAPDRFLIRSGRVRAGYRIGEFMFGGRRGPMHLLHVIGERPGSGHRTLSIYITSADGEDWGKPAAIDHNITKVVSGIASTALLPKQGAEAAARILRSLL
jgi:ethanolamine ammonia-lyase large subunit